MRLKEEQIIQILKQAKKGAKTKELCRQHGITEQTFYRWKSKFGGMEVSDARRLRELEHENAKLMRMIADVMLDNQVLKEINAKKVVKPQAKKAAAVFAQSEFALSERRACRLLQLSRSTRRRTVDRLDEPKVRTRLRELADLRMRFGYRRLHTLQKREGVTINHKKLRRIYREENVSVRSRKKPKFRSIARAPLKAAERANERLSMDFVSDQLESTDRRRRVLAVIDSFTRECVLLYADFSIPGSTVVRELKQAIETNA